MCERVSDNIAYHMIVHFEYIGKWERLEKNRKYIFVCKVWNGYKRSVCLIHLTHLLCYILSDSKYVSYFTFARFPWLARLPLFLSIHFLSFWLSQIFPNPFASSCCTNIMHPLKDAITRAEEVGKIWQINNLLCSLSLITSGKNRGE